MTPTVTQEKEKIDLYCTVVSLVPFDIREEKPGLIPNSFFLPASDMKTPQLLKVGTARHYVYLDQDRGHLPVRTPSTELATSIVRDYITAQQRVAPDAQPALFWIPGNYQVPNQVLKDFPDQVEEALAKQVTWFTRVCQQADDDWHKYHRHTVVSDVQRRMAQILGWSAENHEWMAPNLTAVGVRCPACGTLAMMGAVVCSQCQCILDVERYKTLQFAGQAVQSSTPKGA